MEKIKGYVTFFNKKVPVTWERETNRYVYEVVRLKRKENLWIKEKRNFDDKVDKAEIHNGNFEEEYIPLKEQAK